MYVYKAYIIWILVKSILCYVIILIFPKYNIKEEEEDMRQELLRIIETWRLHFIFLFDFRFHSLSLLFHYLNEFHNLVHYSWGATRVKHLKFA